MHWRVQLSVRLIIGLIVVVIVSGVNLTPALAQNSDPAVQPALTWLRSQQQSDGGYLGFSGTSDPGTTTDVALAFAAADVDPGSVSHGGPSLIDYLGTQAQAYAGTLGGAAKLTIAVVAGGQDPRDFAGQNLVHDILAHYDPSTGLFDPQLYVHAYAMLALSSAGQTVPAASIKALETHQASDGGWAFTGEATAGKDDSNTTAVAIEALVASGDGSSPAIARAMDYLNTLKTTDNLFAYQPTPGTPLVGDANSTALVIQALLATGKAADSSDVTASKKALDGMTNAGSGAFFYRQDAKDDNLLATAQAIPALDGKALPVWPVRAPGRTLEQAKTQAAPGNNQLCVYVQQTGHNACQGFLAYWQRFGGVDVFGYPLTEEFTFVDPATGRPTTMQYFQRARFEWHPGSAPERFDVQLGLLGSEQLSTP